MDRKKTIYVFKIIISFLLISFIADKAVYLLFNKISDDVYSGQSIGKLNQYLKTKNDFDFIVFGSSRANHHVNPNKISNNCYNMGVDGTMIAYSHSLITLLPQKKQTILLHIDPSNVFSNSYLGEDIKALKSKYNRNSIVTKNIDQLGQNNIFQKFYWSLGYNKIAIPIIKNFFKPKYDYKEYNGYDPIYVSKSQQKIFEKILNEPKETDCLETFNVNKLYNKLLDDLVMFSKKNNKELIVFSSPIYFDYCERDNIEFEKIMKEKQIRYYDFTNLFQDNNSIEFWRDRTHLSNIGAEVFSDSLALKIL
ncbi:hypothetical protein [Flagellimonas profundi]|uniref:DUF1574 domain-containing protein n=1 Tax=Flagellimonas profundi TaxID=2915620 RepID=A0ABS3FD72_9FLAO|nr:hypothetical protein [Allomuricauda profundi]MBO0340526.1 hypothetical protein [Allomuricauda profundi]